MTIGSHRASVVRGDARVPATKSGSFCMTAVRLHMFGRCAVRICECIYLACERGVLSGRFRCRIRPVCCAAAKQVHAACATETGNGPARGGSQQAHRNGVLGYEGARRTHG